MQKDQQLTQKKQLCLGRDTAAQTAGMKGGREMSGKGRVLYKRQGFVKVHETNG